MGIGPSVAIPPALKQAGISTKDVDIYEINEAFASQVQCDTAAYHFCVVHARPSVHVCDGSANTPLRTQAVYCCRELGLDMSKVNPNGGAIALGHPLGATGARQIATLLAELKRTNGKLGVVSMCIGTGMGAAAVIEAE